MFGRVPGLLIVTTLLAGEAIAQETPPEARRLDQVERDIKRGEGERDRLFQAQQATARELESIRAALVKAARDLQDQEYSLLVLENRLGDLETEEKVLAQRLADRDRQMGAVLLALERLALRPGDALTLSPLRPADAVRTAILLRAAVPSVQTSAKSLQAELSDLYAVRAEMTTQRERIALGAAELVSKRRDLEGLERTRAERQTQLAAATNEATLRLEQLAGEAQDLRELLEKLNMEKRQREAEARKAADEKKRLADEAAARQEAQAAKSAGTAGPPPAQVATAPPEAAATPPAAEIDLAPLVADLRPFSDARGTLPFPVVGSVTQLYGEADGGSGLRSKGISIKTRPSAPVVAPFDGVVAFAGPFRAYGLLLIIEHSEGYHTLLAGLGRVDCVVGQRVLAGEPVGSMDSDATPSLYVELRRDGQPMNPLPWLASRTGKNSG